MEVAGEKVPAIFFVWRGNLYCKCIRVSEEELDRLKQAARLEAYASYSEFIRRTALKEAQRIIEEDKNKIERK